MRIRVFVQNQAGSDVKHLHDERTLTLRDTTRVSRPYPWPYGFIPGTWADDDCCVDAFVITSRPLATGDIVTCEPFGLLEQIEDGEVDHNVLAVPVGEAAPEAAAVQGVLTEFIQHVFDHVEGKAMQVGRLLGRAEAEAHIAAHVAKDPSP